MSIRLLIIDDHPIIAAALELALKVKYGSLKMSHASSGHEGLIMLRNDDFDLVVLDVNLPDYNVISMIHNIQDQRSDQKILVFTMANDTSLMKRLFSLKINGFVNKAASNEEILEATKRVLNGGLYFPEKFANYAIESMSSGNNPHLLLDSLSHREYQVLTGLLDGKKPGEIAENLGMHVSSVSTYRYRVFRKLGVNNIAELFQRAYEFGLIKSAY